MSYFYNPMQVSRNPMESYQQQLQQLQQMQQAQFQPQQQVQQVQQVQQQPQMQQGFNIIPVGSIDEVKAKTVDWSGRPEYFIDNANGKVYSKFLDVTGIPKINVYSLENDSINKVEYATKEEFNKLKQIIDSFLEGLQGGNKNE